MPKIKLIYASVHHKNTYKLARYLSSKFQDTMELVDILKDKNPDLKDTEYVIFASGIYYGGMHQALQAYMDQVDLTDKKVIFLYTCGIRYKDYAAPMAKLVKRKNGKYLGSCYCRGYDTYSFLKRIGGIAKKHPNERDCNQVLHKLEAILEEKE